MQTQKFKLGIKYLLERNFGFYKFAVEDNEHRYNLTFYKHAQQQIKLLSWIVIFCAIPIAICQLIFLSGPAICQHISLVEISELNAPGRYLSIESEIGNEENKETNVEEGVDTSAELLDKAETYLQFNKDHNLSQNLKVLSIVLLATLIVWLSTAILTLVLIRKYEKFIADKEAKKGNQSIM